MRTEVCEFSGGVSWLEATPAVLRELAEIRRERSDEQALASLTFVLAGRHPLGKPSRRCER